MRVQLDQLVPATQPLLPKGFEPGGNGYQVRLTYASCGAAVAVLAALATLGVSAPAAPTDVLELDGPITLLQVYDPASAPSPSS